MFWQKEDYGRLNLVSTKRSIIGAYHKGGSAKHLDGYLDELSTVSTTGTMPLCENCLKAPPVPCFPPNEGNSRQGTGGKAAHKRP